MVRGVGLAVAERVDLSAKCVTNKRGKCGDAARVARRGSACERGGGAGEGQTGLYSERRWKKITRSMASLLYLFKTRRGESRADAQDTIGVEW